MAKKSNSDIDQDQLNEFYGVASEEERPEKPIKKTLADIERRGTQKMAKTENTRRQLVMRYMSEDKIAVTVSPFYQPYLSKIVRCSVNGIMVEVPANGKTYKINRTHANHIKDKISKIDKLIQRQNRAGNVQNNFERVPGELHI